MASAKVVHVPNFDGHRLLRGRLFGGKRFWLSVRVPSRPHMIDLIEANGGEIVSREEESDMQIADGKMPRKAAPGSYSYEFITESVRRGIEEDRERHLISLPTRSGPASTLPGATKGTRTPFSTEDDRILMHWVTEHERKGAKILGNEIYKDLAQINPRHTYQSWRDRWIKSLSLRPRPESSTPPSSTIPPSDNARAKNSGDRGRVPRELIASANKPICTKHDFLLLMEHGADIASVPIDQAGEAWIEWAREKGGHSAREWQKIWECEVLPTFARLPEIPPDRMLAQASNVSHRPKGPVISCHGSSPSSPQQCPTKRALPLQKCIAETHRSARPHQRGPLTTGSVSTSKPHSLPAMPERPLTPAIPSVTPKRRHAALEPDEVDPSGPNRRENGRGESPAKKQKGPRIPTPQEGEYSVLRSQLQRALSSAPRHSLFIHDNDDDDDDDNGSGKAASPPSPTLTEPGSSHSTVASSNGLPPKHRTAITSLTHCRQDVEDDGAKRSESEEGDDDDLPSFDLSPTRPLDTMREILETQGIHNYVNSELIDLHDPDSDPAQAEALLSHAASPPRSLGPASHVSEFSTTSREPADALDDWINALVDRGADEDQVLMSLRVTSMNTALAQLVLLSIANDHGFPSEIPGVWTEEEDAVLRAGRRSKIKKLREKHGDHFCDERLQFLDHYERHVV